MEPLQFNCPLCSGLFQIDPSMAGGQVLCPSCQGTVTIPALTAPPPVGPATAMELSCPLCTGVFQVTPEMAGQQVSCPHCTGVVMIPGETPPPPTVGPAVGEAPAPYAPPPPEPTLASANDAPTFVAPTTSEAAPKKQVQEPRSSEMPDLYPPGFQPKVAEPDKKSEKKTTKSGTVPKSSPAEQPAKDINSMLPPGDPDAAATPQSAGSAESKADGMLPPGAGVSPSTSSTKKKSKADELLPPGAEAKQDEPELKQKALPDSEKNRPVKKNKDIVIKTEDGSVATLHEPEKTVGEGASKVRLRTLSVEEKTRRRSFKSLIMWLVCVVMLIIALIFFVNM